MAAARLAHRMAHRPARPRPQPQRAAKPTTHPQRPIAAPPGGAPGQPAAGAGSPYDYSSDPILQQIRAAAAANQATAEAGAQAARTQALIRFGYDPGMASLYGDQNTAGAAKANPFSTLANLARQHEQRARSIDENRNKENLFYSSTRGTQLQNEGTQYLGEQAGAQGALQQLLGGIGEQLAGARSTEQDRITQGMQDAYGRALQFGLQYGVPGAGAGAAPRGAVPAAHPNRSALQQALQVRSARARSRQRRGRP